MSTESVIPTESATQTSVQPSVQPRWLFRLTVLAVCLVWPLIWVGGLVTTYDAGMSVPDWPNTYGDNLFLYPYSTWLAGPFDLFIEHGHRLLGALVGLVAIGIVIVAFVTETRRWVKVMSVALLVMVIVQGMLGGMRVVLGDRTLAMVHGCFGPAFFAFCVAMAVVTGKKWRTRTSGDLARPLSRVAIVMPMILVALSYWQLVFGAMMRHVQPTAEPGGFTLIVSVHIMTAFAFWAVTPVVWWRLRRCGDLTLSRPAGLLVGLVGLQILLGIGTWVVNYGWPSFVTFVPGSESFLVRAKGFVDSIIVTSHVATGSLILAISAMLLVRVWRARHVQQTSDPDKPEATAESTPVTEAPPHLVTT